MLRVLDRGVQDEESAVETRGQDDGQKWVERRNTYLLQRAAHAHSLLLPACLLHVLIWQDSQSHLNVALMSLLSLTI